MLIDCVIDFGQEVEEVGGMSGKTGFWQRAANAGNRRFCSKRWCLGSMLNKGRVVVVVHEEREVLCTSEENKDKTE